MKKLLFVILLNLFFIKVVAQEVEKSEYYASLKYKGYLFEADRKGYFAEGILKITFPNGKSRTYNLGTIETLVEADLNNDGKTEVLVGDYSGGAHCCYSYRVYSIINKKLKVSNVVNTGHCPVELKDVNSDSTIELISCNSNYAYVYASFISSILPARIYIYNNNIINDNTSNYKDYLRTYLVDEYKRLDEIIKDDFNGRINCIEKDFDEDSMWGPNEGMNNLRAKIASVFTLKYFVDGRYNAIEFLKNIYRCKQTYKKFEKSLLELIKTYK
ncbi:MAG TPA: hypothetical protein VFF33_02620 [Ignavibacteriaceae bacterium]|nr:hypothetical protein [Ignavibacteriaceae bacterium]